MACRSCAGIGVARSAAAVAAAQMVWSSYETSGDALSPARAAVDAAIPARTAIRAMRLRKGRERGSGILPLLLAKGGANFMKIERASCRERVCQGRVDIGGGRCN